MRRIDEVTHGDRKLVRIEVENLGSTCLFWEIETLESGVWRRNIDKTFETRALAEAVLRESPGLGTISAGDLNASNDE